MPPEQGHSITTHMDKTGQLGQVPKLPPNIGSQGYNPAGSAKETKPTMGSDL